MIDYRSGQFWSVNKDFYLNFDNSIECFSSLFNHTLNNFFSLFDEEIIYGSKGNFFSKFLESNYKYYLINPPFTESIILKMFDFIIKKIRIIKDIKEIVFILYLPGWYDIIDKFLNEVNKINKINNKQLFTKLKKYNQGEVVLFDYINNKYIKPMFKSCIIVISNIENNIIDLFDKYNNNNNK